MRNLLIVVAGMINFCFINAENPVVQTHCAPDPAPMVYKNTLYMYTGDDIPGTDFYYMIKWRVMSTTDMVNWTDHGSPIALEDFSWARDRAWAAQCIERNGKFYWYVCAQTIHNDMAIGVAVSDSPTGPFKDALGKPLITNGSWSNIDPTVWIDTDGQAYLYWGNGTLFYVKLNQDMISYSGDIVSVPMTAESFGGVRTKPGSGELSKDMFVEAPWLYKRGSIYYMMYAGMSGREECLSYATSASATGPWKYAGKIMDKQLTNSFTNHGGIVDFKGNSYLFYHSGLLHNDGSFGRRACVEQFTYKPDGSIPEIKAGTTGPMPVGSIDPYQRVEAETMAWSEKCAISELKNGSIYVSGIRQKGYIKVRQVDFGKRGPSTFEASLAAGLDGGVLEVHSDSIAGPLLATVAVQRTGSWEQFSTFSSDVNASITGIHDLYLCFKGQNVTSGRELFNFDWWKFGKKK